MSSLPHQWWVARRDDLLGLLRERCPVAVYDGETINDILFDLLSIESIEKLFYPLAANPHPEILERAFTLGAGFKCTSAPEARKVFESLPQCPGHQVMFVPEGEYTDDWADPLKTGALAVLNDLGPLDKASIFFKGRNLLACVDLSGRGRKEAAPTARITALQDRLNALGARLTGFYVPGKADLADLRALIRDFPDCKILCLGGGWGITPTPETGCPDPLKTAENLEEVRDLFPGLGLWVDPGHGVLDCAAGMLTRVTARRKENGVTSFCLDTAGKGVVFSRMLLQGSRILDLSGEPDRGLPREMVCISGYERGNPVCIVPDSFAADQGDPCLITPIAAPGDNGAVFTEHYLHARRICRVPL